MIYIQVIGAFVGVIAIAITFGVPKKFLPHSGFVGAIGWFSYLILKSLGWNTVIRMFFAALVIAIISHTFARIFKTPVTLFLVAGILPLVPGLGMYRIVHNLLINNNAMAGAYLRETIQIAGMIALAIFIVDTFFRIFQKR